MWEVRLIKRPPYGTWPSSYFPRQFRYKVDAEGLQGAVLRADGLAEVVPLKPRRKKAALGFTPAQIAVCDHHSMVAADSDGWVSSADPEKLESCW